MSYRITITFLDFYNYYDEHPTKQYVVDEYSLGTYIGKLVVALSDLGMKFTLSAEANRDAV